MKKDEPLFTLKEVMPEKANNNFNEVFRNRKKDNYLLYRRGIAEPYKDSGFGIREKDLSFRVTLEKGYKKWLSFEAVELPDGVCLDIEVRAAQKRLEGVCVVGRRKKKVEINLAKYCGPEDAIKQNMNPYRVLKLATGLLKKNGVKVKDEKNPTRDGSCFVEFVFTYDAKGSVLMLLERANKEIIDAMEVSRKNIIKELVREGKKV